MDLGLKVIVYLRRQDQYAFSYYAQNLALSDLKGNIIDRFVDGTVPFRNAQCQMFYIQQRFFHTCIPQARYLLRIPSPIELSPIIVITIMIPGAMAAQGAL